MSVHDDMKGWQKGIWMLIIGAFLITELRAISKDRAINQAQALQDRRDQDAAFKTVRDSQNAGFTATASGLTAAIGGIKSTLTTADKTLIQTQPHAALHLDNVEFYPSAPAEIKTDTQYAWNYHFTNSGTATAREVTVMQRIYLDTADDTEAQVRLADRFNKEWKTGKQKSNVVIVPNIPLFNSLTRTFSNEETQNMAKKTIYFMFRFEYSDETGRWRMDDCKSLQRTPAGINMSVFHVCHIFVNARYPVTP